ncbi:MAG: DUF885 domain-containing protein [Clostridiales bacterium]|nr:DUF885 domain-containing protein [Clostridiales bacterium]
MKKGKETKLSYEIAKVMLLLSASGMLFMPLSACSKDESIATPPLADDGGKYPGERSSVNWDDVVAPTYVAQTPESMELHDFDLSYFVGISDILNAYYVYDDPTQFYTNWPSEGLYYPTEADYTIASDSYRDCIEYLKGFDRTQLTDEDLRLLDDMIFDFSCREEVYKYYYYLPQFFPRGGIQVTYPLLTSLIQFTSKSDVERYFLILEDYGDYFAKAVETEKSRSAMGIGWGDEHLDQIIADCQTILDNKATGFMKTTFESRLGALHLSQQETEDYLARNQELLDTVVYPAFEMMVTELTALKGTGSDSVYLASTPEGKAFYEAYFRMNAGVDLSVDECTRILQDKIDAIYAEYEPRWVTRGSYFTFGDMEFQEAWDWCERFTRDHFPEILNNEVSVYEVPKDFSDSMQPATYYVSPIDKFTKHSVWVNTGLVEDDLYDMFTLISHEMYPGHLYQHQYQAENLNNYYQAFAASLPYAEGWAQYSEWIMIHYAPFDQEMAENAWMGQTLYSTLIAARLSIGIEYEGWSYSDCLAYIEKYDQDDTVMQDYWTHITSSQCYAVEYAMGYIFTEQILDHALEELDGKVAPEEIYKAYLDLGCAPFEVLEKYMNEYIDENK